MDTALAYLLNFLEEEFRSYPDVRVRLTPSAGTVKSPDLEQTYDPEAKTLHTERGVLVLTIQREYYFPAQWVTDREYTRVQKLAEQIKESL
jgi:hypothetical protein